MAVSQHDSVGVDDRVPSPDSRRVIDGGRDEAATLHVERAKGVLMGRHGLSEQQAHAMLRRHARNSNLRLCDVATAVLNSHVLLGGMQS
jgi:response regulator NasT